MSSKKEPTETLDFAVKKSMLAKSKLAIITNNPGGVVHYTCVECSAKYDDKEELERHLMIHYNEYRFLCGICGTGLKRREHYDRHTLEHQEVRPHICPDCGKAFKRREHLNIHQAIHSGDRREECPMCSKTFSRRDHLRKHLQIHTKMATDQNVDVAKDNGYEDIKQEIEIIIENEFQPSTVEDHDEEVMEPQQEKYNTSVNLNKSNLRPHMCTVCNKSYKRKDHLRIHSWTHLKKDKVCSECGRAFHTDEQLISHMNIHLQPYFVYNKDNYCEEPTESDAYSSDNSLLVARAASSLNGESRPHECTICHRRFKRKQHLKAHLNVHNKQQFCVWCNFCGEGFPTNEEFESHQCPPSARETVSEQYDQDEDQVQHYNQHEDQMQHYDQDEDQVQHYDQDEDQVQHIPQEAKKENKYPEEYMDVEELVALESAQYVDVEVEEKALPIPQRVFVCKYCSKPFKRKDHYKIHLHIHTGIKSFFCPECGKGFYRKDHMQKHTMIHNKIKPKKEVPDLYPINVVPKKEIKPEITIHAPSNTKLRMPLQIKVPYQMVVSLDNGEKRAVTIDPQASTVSS